MILVCASAVPRSAYGDDIDDGSSRAFSCVSEARAFVQEHSLVEIRAERDRRRSARAGSDEPATLAAHRWCLIAELTRSLGDDSAPLYYARAIAATGDLGYELRLADYFRVVRGPRRPLSERAERHYRAALDGVRARADSPAASDHAIARSATHGLRQTYQQDGVVVLPLPSPEHATSPGPSLSVMVGGRVGFDTNETPVDASSLAQVDDARRFASEAMFAASRFRKAQPLRDDELRAIARAPLRAELMVRGRLRSRPLGAVDLWYRRGQVYGGEITSYQLPMVVNDISMSELGAGFARVLDLSPAFDLLLAGDYRRVHRVGVVESAPDQAQGFNVFGVRPVLARFLGPDKLSLAASYTVMAIPDLDSGVIANRARGRTISAVDVDYAANRLLLRPYELPALRAFAGLAQDAETFGTRTVRRRDVYLGVGMSRFHHWDVTAQGSLLFGAVAIRPEDAGEQTAVDPQQSNAHYRTTVSLLRRLVDEDAPGLGRELDDVKLSSLSAVATVRHDVALRGLTAYENVRMGLELCAKTFVRGLRDTAVLLSAGYDNQYFYAISEDVHIFHLDMRIGW